MKPLSILKFIKGSIRKILPLTITLCLAVSLLYFLTLVSNQLTESVKEINMYPMLNMSLIYTQGSQISDEDIDKLNNSKDIKEWYRAKMFGVTYNMTAGGTVPSMAVMVEKDNVNIIMKQQQSHLIKGELPKDPMELVVHRKIAANKGLEIGTVVKKDTPGWRIEDDIKVVGIFDGPGVFSIGVEDGDKLKEGFGLSIITVAHPEALDDMNQYIEQNFIKNFELYTLPMIQNWLKKVQGPLDAMILLIGVVLVVVLAVLLGNISMIQYTQRRKEFEILHAIGYTKKYIAFKMLKELGISSTIGYISGIIFAIAFGWVINICFWSEKAMEMSLIQIPNMILLMIVPVIITLTGMIAPLKMLKFRDIA